MQIEVKNISGKKVGDLELDDAVFGAEVHEHLLWETVKWQLAARRSGNASTKRRDEVSGSTKKPFKQKGTGRARQGSHRAPQWVGGGSVFGPKPRSYTYAHNKKARKHALRSALSLRAKEGKLTVIDAFPVDGGKTRNVVKALSALGTTQALIVDVKDNELLVRGARNLTDAKWIAPAGINVYDVLDHEHLVMTQACAKLVEQALRP